MLWWIFGSKRPSAEENNRCSACFDCITLDIGVDFVHWVEPCIEPNRHCSLAYLCLFTCTIKANAFVLCPLKRCSETDCRAWFCLRIATSSKWVPPGDIVKLILMPIAIETVLKRPCLLNCCFCWNGPWFDCCLRFPAHRNLCSGLFKWFTISSI